MKILAIIPARGGSKGIKDKNIVEVQGKPLLAYTAGPALQLLAAGHISELILSTDSPDIAEVGRRLGVKVPFLRPEALSGDAAKAIEYVLHALSFYEAAGSVFDAVLILQPTSPLRTFADLRAAIELFETQGGDSLISVYEEAYINDLVMYKRTPGGHEGLPLNALHNRGVRRQEHGAVYVRNGCIYLTRTAYIQAREMIIADRPLLYVMDKERSLNIDTPADLELLRKLI